nr:polynucleotide 3'-phosphatase ZDP-like isoform X2 [Physcomitrium patens]|eukprot:XP_024377413.1 polynucleotide 3'-phosphatase ZDP-like isoform X2 [Physcomitrella patens]
MLRALASVVRVTMPPRHAVEYAKSERSQCKSCGERIAKGVVRLASITWVKGYSTPHWHHPDCYLATKSNAALVALAVDENKLDGFPTLKASDQAALKALTGPVDVEETRDGEPSESRSIKSMKDSSGSALEVSVQGETSQAVTGSPDRKRKVSPGIAAKMNQIEKEQDAKLPLGWKSFSSVILHEAEGLQPSEKIAAFDFDGCLANTHVRRSGADAWKLMYPSIPKILQGYHRDGYKLVVFTNESNIERWTKSRQKAVDSKVGRLEAFINVVEVPMHVFISCGKEGSGDACRKPSPGMWHLLERHLNGGVPINKESSFYVGDAAGRKSDHSAADLGFAQAVGLKFYVPEEVFE